MSVAAQVVATDAALAAIERLTAEHGPLMLFQSGGCCDGTPAEFPWVEGPLSRIRVIGRSRDQPGGSPARAPRRRLVSCFLALAGNVHGALTLADPRLRPISRQAR